MYCENCGEELDRGASFCNRCGQKVRKPKAKNILIAVILSFIFTGLGTIYAGNTRKGLILIAIRILCAVISVLIPVLLIINVFIWAYGIYDAYLETQRANGDSNPNLISDFRAWDSHSRIIAVIVIIVVLIICVYGAVSFITPIYENPEPASHSSHSTSSGSGGSYHYGGVDDSPSTIASNDPDWYYDHYDYGDNDKIDEYLESQGYD